MTHCPLSRGELVRHLVVTEIRLAPPKERIFIRFYNECHSSGIHKIGRRPGNELGRFIIHGESHGFIGGSYIRIRGSDPDEDILAVYLPQVGKRIPKERMKCSVR